jgi:peptide/nickel transport system permease protein
MAAGIAVVVIMTIISLMAPLLFTDDPYKGWPPDRLQPPSAEHWFGTDFIGRDVYSRAVYGGRISILVGFSVAAISIGAAMLIGLLSGYFKIVDAIVMRIMDGIMSVPIILLAIALMALLGGSVQNVIFGLSFVVMPRAARVMRASVLTLKEEMFVEAARSIGASTFRILFRHILPNALAPMIVIGTFICAEAILIEAILSFLGAGTPPETPSWGTMMAEARRAISVAVWVIGFPGLFLSITVLGINLAGDGLRDLLDPKLARRL